ncbi:hypothetical protein D3C87_1365370 [compost metagenome]
MVHDAAVGFFGHALIEATVARFHVKDRNLAALGRNHREAAVGVAQHQHGFGLHLAQHLVHRDDEVADGVRRAGGVGRAVQKVVGLAHAQVVEEDLVEFVVVVLAGMHEHVFAMLVQPSQHARQANDFGPGADHGHDFEFFH